jgi:hypothetical protein
MKRATINLIICAVAFGTISTPGFAAVNKTGETRIMGVSASKPFAGITKGQEWIKGNPYFNEKTGEYELPKTGTSQQPSSNKIFVGKDIVRVDNRTQTWSPSADEQKQLKKIFGKTVATIQGTFLAGGTHIKYYDAKGKLIGTYDQVTGTQKDQPGIYRNAAGKVVKTVTNTQAQGTTQRQGDVVAHIPVDDGTEPTLDDIKNAIPMPEGGL